MSCCTLVFEAGRLHRTNVNHEEAPLESPDTYDSSAVGHSRTDWRVICCLRRLNLKPAAGAKANIKVAEYDIKLIQMKSIEFA